VSMTRRVSYAGPFSTVFREIDKDGSRTIDFGEFFDYFRAGANTRSCQGST